MAVFERETLPNGLRLLSAPMPQVQSVACFIMLAAGSRYETPETSGIAHFAEHMFFKGTENRPTAQIIGIEMDGIGAEFNAFTGKEYTGYYVKCAAEHRGHAFDVLVDMLRHSKFEPEEIEREKGVIVEEMNMYFDTPRDYIGGVYHQLLYGDRRSAGTSSAARRRCAPRRARRSSTTSTAGTRAPKMVVGIAGNFDEGIRQEVEEMLGEVEPGDPGGADPASGLERRRAERPDPLEGVRPGAHRDRRAELSAVHPDRYRAPAARDGARNRDVVSALHRGAGAARARVLRLRDEPLLHRHGDALLPGRRRHQAHRRGDRDDRARAEEDRRRACARRGAREGEERRQGAVRSHRPRARTG